MNLVNEFFNLPENCKFKSFGSGHMNETWCVSCDGRNLYALRKYNASRNVSLIELEHKALMVLKDIFGDLISAPLKSINFKTIENIDNSLYSLFPFIKGETPSNDNRQHTELTARTLAATHKKLWCKRHLFENISSGRKSISMERFLSPNQIYKELRSELTEDSLLSLGITREMLSSLETKTMKALERLEPYIKEKHLIHGDYGSRNLLMDNETNTINAILDWEEMRWDSPVFELASTVNFCDMDYPGSGKIFLTEYMNELQRISHPEQKTMLGSANHIDDAILCANYLELTLMIESGNLEVEYIQFLVKTMA